MKRRDLVLSRKKIFWRNLTSGDLEIVGNRKFFFDAKRLKNSWNVEIWCYLKKKIFWKNWTSGTRNFLNCRKSKFFFFDARRLENARNVEIWCMSKSLKSNFFKKFFFQVTPDLDVSWIFKTFGIKNFFSISDNF